MHPFNVDNIQNDKRRIHKASNMETGKLEKSQRLILKVVNN